MARKCQLARRAILLLRVTVLFERNGPRHRIRALKSRHLLSAKNTDGFEQMVVMLSREGLDAKIAEKLCWLADDPMDTHPFLFSSL